MYPKLASENSYGHSLSFWNYHLYFLYMSCSCKLATFSMATEANLPLHCQLQEEQINVENPNGGPYALALYRVLSSFNNSLFFIVSCAFVNEIALLGQYVPNLFSTFIIQTCISQKRGLTINIK